MYFLIFDLDNIKKLFIWNKDKDLQPIPLQQLNTTKIFSLLKPKHIIQNQIHNNNHTLILMLVIMVLDMII